MNPDQRQSFMAVSLFSFLDNLLGTSRSLPGPPTPEPERPPTPPPRPDIKAGGYPEEMFVFLSDKDKEDYSCSVCYSILKDAHQCRNKHKFCYTCVYEWSTSPVDGSQFCPMCREEGVYARNDIINTIIGRKRVKCPENGCNWRGQLINYENHSHRQYDDKELSRDLVLPAINPVNKARVPITSVVDSSNMSTSDFMRSLNRDSGASASDSQNRPSTPRLNAILTPVSPSNSINSSSSTTSISSTTSTSTNSSTNRSTPTLPIRRNSDASTSSATTDTQRRNSIGPRRIVRSNEQSSSTRSSVTDNRSNSQRRDSLPNRRDSVSSNISGNNSGPVNRPGLIPRPPAQARPRTQNQAVNPANRPLLATRNNSSETTGANVQETISVPQSDVNLENIHFATASSSSSSTNTTTTNRPETPPAQRQLPPNPPANAASDSDPGNLVYRRLAPARPLRRTSSQAGERLREGREQLALMLTLMTLELEERRRNIERHARENQERERIRLQEIAEVQQLNRRLSVVTNNLERLLDSNQSRASSPPTLPSSTSETRARNSSMPPPRQRLDIRFAGIGGISGMSDSSDTDD